WHADEGVFLVVDSIVSGADGDHLSFWTDAEGRFRVRLSKAGRYRVAFFPSGQVLGEFEVGATGELARDFILPASRITGRILDSDGQPVSMSRVTLSNMTGRIEHWGASDAQGRFVFEHVEPGVYFVAARSTPSWRGGERVDRIPAYWPVAVLWDGHSPEISLTQRSLFLREISGVAREPNGALARDGTLVIIERHESFSDAVEWYATELTEGGRFRGVVPPGRYRLLATDGYSPIGLASELHARAAEKLGTSVEVGLLGSGVNDVELSVNRNMPD
ncbi:MAG TPA: carboxypeptidase-like regulatory domain-containing protein, partial [Myxococcota bacterium]|nr:carboxypeptidase-like regulatory domain-containing protein [Myxococcota bacterium]